MDNHLEEISFRGPRHNTQKNKFLLKPDILKAEIYNGNDLNDKIYDLNLNSLYLSYMDTENQQNLENRRGPFNIDYSFEDEKMVLNGRIYKNKIENINYNNKILEFILEPIIKVHINNLYNASVDGYNNLLYLKKSNDLLWNNITRIKFKVYFSENGANKIEKYLVKHKL